MTNAAGAPIHWKSCSQIGRKLAASSAVLITVHCQSPLGGGEARCIGTYRATALRRSGASARGWRGETVAGAPACSSRLRLATRSDPDVLLRLVATRDQR